MRSFEAGEANPWRFYLPDDLRKPEDLTSAIVGFEIEIERIEAKFKLSQNLSEMDRQGVIRGLRDRKDEMSRGIAEMMEGRG